MPISTDDFATVCYLVLMQNGDGLADKHPSYISEKKYMLESGLDAFGALDIHNMRKVRDWCASWGVEMPPEAADELKMQEEAAERLKDLGFEL